MKWVDDRLSIVEAVETELYRRVPNYTLAFHRYLGGMALIILVIEFITGFLLGVYYAVAHHLARGAHHGLGLVIHAAHYTHRGYDGAMPGYTKDKQKIETRLRRIEGQVRGIQKMVEDDRYCIDVLTQVNATRAALESVALQLLADHTEHCVTEAIRSGGGAKKVQELNEAVERLVRS